MHIVVLAGPNGSGKSTSARALVPTHFPPHRFLNADDIAASLGTDSMVTAGRIMLRRMRTLREAGVSFVMETTLAGRHHAAFLREARDEGYSVEIVYLWLPSPQIAIDRVALRVRRGGHDVPRVDIVRRYHRGVRNLFTLYMSLANHWEIRDGRRDNRPLIAWGGSSRDTMILDAKAFRSLRSIPGR